MRKSWLIAAVIGGAAGAAQAADVQLFGIHIPQNKQFAVYSVVSNAASSSPLPGRTSTVGIASMWIEVLNNGGATVATAQNRLPVGTHNDPAATIDPSNRYGFWVFQPPQPTIDATGAKDIRAGQFTEYNPEQAATYDQYVLQRVGMEPGAKPAGGTIVSPTNWARPVLVARGTYTGDAGTAGLSLQYRAGSGVNVLRDMDPNPDVTNYTGVDLTPADVTDNVRVEGANSTVVDARTFTTGTVTPGTTTVKAGWGDSNLDGNVNFTDLVALAQNYGSSSRSWFQGDFNLDNEVNFSDLVLLAQNYGQPVPASGTFGASFEADMAAAFAQVPEPSALTFVGVAAAALVGRRRRK
jgi:hypothetical protein